MFSDLLHIKNYKLFLINMIMLGMAMAITIPFLVLYATNELGMTTRQYGLLLALAAVSQFVINTIIARFSDRAHFKRKWLIIVALLMGAVSFSIYFYVHQIWLFIVLYALFQGLFAPAMPQMYASARASINVSASSGRAQFANAVLRSMFSFGFLFGPLIGTILLSTRGYAGLFGGTIVIIMLTLLLQIIFFKDVKEEQTIVTSHTVEKTAPNMLKDIRILIPFLAFILLHIGQWMYTLNMPLYVTQVLGEDEKYVGYLASLCAGLEVPFMVVMGILSSKLPTRVLLINGGAMGAIYFGSIGMFDNIVMMLIGQVFLAFFLAILLGLGISYFQDVFPDFPGYASTLFANAMVIGQLGGNLIGGEMSNLVGLGNVFFVSAGAVLVGMILISLTKDTKITEEAGGHA